MAEGSTGAFFDTDILLANPNPVPVPVNASFLAVDGTTITQALTLPAMSRTTIPVDRFRAAKRPPYRRSSRRRPRCRLASSGRCAGMRAGTAPTPRRPRPGRADVVFAEGAQGFFSTSSCSPTRAWRRTQRAWSSCVRTAPRRPGRLRSHAASRYTLYAGDVPELVNDRSESRSRSRSRVSPSVRCTSAPPLFNGGHASAGVTAPSTSWFLAEGATGSFFTTFLLLANPGRARRGDRDVPAGVGRRGHEDVHDRRQAAPDDQRRARGSVVGEHRRGLAGELDVPVVAERAQYWPNTPDQWYQAHNSFGETGTATRWVLAEGRVGGPNSYRRTS